MKVDIAQDRVHEGWVSARALVHQGCQHLDPLPQRPSLDPQHLSLGPLRPKPENLILMLETLMPALELESNEAEDPSVRAQVHRGLGLGPSDLEPSLVTVFQTSTSKDQGIGTVVSGMEITPHIRPQELLEK